MSASSVSTVPVEGAPSEVLRAAIDYAVQAPSSHNTQPWLFRVQGDGLELYADRTRALPVIDPDDRELTMSVGAALLHARVALRHFGWESLIERLPAEDDDDWLARVRLGAGRSPTPDEEQLFLAIAKRHTNRFAFEPCELPESLVSALQLDAREEGAWLYVARDLLRDRLADLIAEGDRLQSADRSFRRELAAWMHPSRSRSRDGMPAYALGRGALAAELAPFVVRTFDVGRGQAARDRELARGSPVLAVLGTSGDGPANWLAAGEALDRVLLHAAAKGVSASFLNQPVEVRALRGRVAELIEMNGYPQLVLRLGYGPETPATPRRSVSEVMI
jgi:hypothetical protein